MDYIFKPVTIFAGHYGSGKTTAAINAALYIRSVCPNAAVTLADLDIVNPYFRAADLTSALAEKNISVSVSKYANSNLDIPAMGSLPLPSLESALAEYVLIDVGGDDAGAVALGRYESRLRPLYENGKAELLYVINKYRLLTQKPSEAAEFLREIESACGYKATGIVNNSNLGAETSAKDVLSSQDYAAETAALAGIPCVFTAADKKLNLGGGGIFNLDNFTKTV